MQHKELHCPYCLRILPNNEFLTDVQCIWCDSGYYQHKAQKAKLNKNNQSKAFNGIGKYKALSYTTQKSHFKVIAEGDFLDN